MSETTTRSSLSIAAACELFGILGLVFGGYELLFSYWPLGLAILGLVLVAFGAALWIRREAVLEDEKQDRYTHVVYGNARVDEDVLADLRAEAMPLPIIRAVRRVGSQKSLRRFRILLEKQCQYNIADEQLETVLRLVSKKPAPQPESPAPESPAPAPTSTVVPPTADPVPGPMPSLTNESAVPQG